VASRARARTLPQHRGEDGGHWSGWCKPRAGATGFAGLRVLERPNRLSWAVRKMEKWEGKEEAGRAEFSF
jgi:hypothetical protein